MRNLRTEGVVMILLSVFLIGYICTVELKEGHSIYTGDPVSLLYIGLRSTATIEY